MGAFEILHPNIHPIFGIAKDIQKDLDLLYTPNSEWLSIVCNFMIFLEYVGSRARLSAEPTGQNRTVSGQKPTNQRFVGFFYCL